MLLDNSITAGNSSNDIIRASNSVVKWKMGNDIGTNDEQIFYLFDLERPGGVPSLYINSAGNMGIGTTNPTAKLSVNGNLWATEIQIAPTNPWPDYVFSEDCIPMSLPNLETYIKTNKHLPGIPAAQEIAKNGLNLGEMNAALLKKIEELTLHLLHLKKENNELKKSVERIDNLEQVINQLTLKNR